jgi:hypothetical protein
VRQEGRRWRAARLQGEETEQSYGYIRGLQSQGRKKQPVGGWGAQAPRPGSVRRNGGASGPSATGHRPGRRERHSRGNKGRRRNEERGGNFVAFETPKAGVKDKRGGAERGRTQRCAPGQCCCRPSQLSRRQGESKHVPRRTRQGIRVRPNLVH